jgi:hypothetical protein
MAPEQIFKQAEKIGLQAVAITDHDTIPKVPKQNNIIHIPGIEVSTNKGHVLVLGIEELPPKEFLELVDFAKSRGAVTIAAHPFGGFFRPGPKDQASFGSLDAIEVLNGHSFPWKNNKAMKLANGLSKVSGSDAHLPEELGSFACEINAHDLDSILKAIRKSKVELPDKNTRALEILYEAVKRKLLRVYPNNSKIQLAP